MHAEQFFEVIWSNSCPAYAQLQIPMKVLNLTTKITNDARVHYLIMPTSGDPELEKVVDVTNDELEVQGMRPR